MVKSHFTGKKFQITIIVMLFVMAVATQAQVTLTIPTDDIFTKINEWIVTYAPYIAIGIGITVAIDILRFVGELIIDAFRGR